jgi:hypothetical protein
VLCALAISACGRVATTVNAGGSPLTITTSALPDGKVGKPYNTTLQAAGGTGAYRWGVAAGTLAHGLDLDPASGAITGTPDADGDSDTAVTFSVSDSSSPTQTASATLSMHIAARDLDILTTSLPAGTVGTPYSVTLTSSGGTAPETWTLTAGALPPGLTLNGATGVISGTPTAAVSRTLSLQVTDAGKPVQSQLATLVLNITGGVGPPGLQITTAALPAGTVGTPYNATLGASGGTPPYGWALTGGTLPAGLALAPSGAITGTPTAAASATPLTFKVTDSGNPALSQSATLPLTISASGGISVAISPRTAALTVTQSIQVSATTSDQAGVSWSLTPAGGTIVPAKSLSLAKVSLTAPAAAGVYTLTASSVSNPAVSASITVAVTNLAGVYTYHDDLARDGANTQEYALTPANVNGAQFSKLFSCAADGAVYAQPLWVANLSIGGVRHNVLFVATEHDSLFAYDADASPCVTLWQKSLIDGAHGGTAGETAVPWTAVGEGSGDIQPEVGVTGTPVIDPAAGILYVVSKSVNAAGTSFYQRLHAIDLASGAEKPGSPATIAASYPGSGDGTATTGFSARQENQRAGLALVGGSVYIAFASHEDNPPWYGWVIAYTYDGSGFAAPVALNVCPNLQKCGIWMSGGAPSADGAGHLYVITGNGGFDATNAPPAHNDDYGDSFLQLARSGPALGVSSWFAPADQGTDDSADRDFGAGGSAVVLNLPAGSPQHLVVGGGKDGTLYLLNGDAMGGYVANGNDANARQFFPLGHPIFATGAFWNNTFYIAGLHGPLNAFAFDPGTGMFNPTATSQSQGIFGFPGSTPSVSALGTGNGIVWSLDNGQYCTKGSRAGCGPAVLHAHSAGNLGTELWNSSLVPADAAGNAVKFTVPTVANGKVYVGDRGNNTGGADNSSSTPGQIDVYGLKP